MSYVEYYTDYNIACVYVYIEIDIYIYIYIYPRWGRRGGGPCPRRAPRISMVVLDFVDLVYLSNYRMHVVDLGDCLK